MSDTATSLQRPVPWFTEEEEAMLAGIPRRCRRPRVAQEIWANGRLVEGHQWPCGGVLRVDPCISRGVRSQGGAGAGISECGLSPGVATSRACWHRLLIAIGRALLGRERRG